MPGRMTHVYLGLLAALAIAVGLSIAVGTCGVPFAETWRVLGAPRLVMGMLGGASLALAGAMFQALFRNPLASPYTLGVSSGASLGAVAVIVLLEVEGLWLGLPVVSLAAFGGAGICVMIVYAIVRARRVESTATLLLAGITIGFLCSAIIVLLMFLGGEHDISRAVRWMMGSVNRIVGFDPVYESLAMLALAGGVVVYLHRDLDLLMMGESVAASRGVAVRRSRALIYFSASLLTAGVVAHCGPIGFVGLVVPHMMRFVVGPRHRYLLPACALAGAAFLPLCDAVARNAMWWLRGESRLIPVGVLTNLMGGSFFLYLLLTRRGGRTLH